MKRSARQELAKETVEIVERGSYVSPHGCQIDLSGLVQACKSGTRHYTPAELAQLLQSLHPFTPSDPPVACEVVNETTLSGIFRLLASGAGPVAALNFASAKNPGGGFLNGSQAQEESLARSSALYASLLQAGNYYEQHRASPSLLYTDAMIFSPTCPIFRDDGGTLLEVPQLVTFIITAAPNAGAIADNRPQELPQISDTLRQRAEYVLALAASHGYQHLVLGAWGCGVFRNDPQLVASIFAELLRHPNWSRRFRRVLFSVLDHSPTQSIFRAFQKNLS